MELTAEQVRVLGCLIEKGATTPDHYPLSTNALVSACNQKSNREPVVAYTESQVVAAMLEIRRHGLARTNGSGRSDKHRHILPDALGLDQDQLALLAIMLLRGPQSPGELKTRTERYPTSQGHGFGSLDDVEAVLAGLAGRGDPLVENIGRGSGQSQDRWAHLLGDGVPDVNDTGDGGYRSADGGGPIGDSSGGGPSLAQRVTDLEQRLARLEAELGVDQGEPAADEPPES